MKAQYTNVQVSPVVYQGDFIKCTKTWQNSHWSKLQKSAILV